MTTTREGLCPEKDGRRYCTSPEGHEGKCHYYIAGGQGGSHVNWWGANPRPIESVSDLSHANLIQEILRLRKLCDEAGIDWLTDVTVPGHTTVVPAEASS